MFTSILNLPSYFNGVYFNIVLTLNETFIDNMPCSKLYTDRNPLLVITSNLAARSRQSTGTGRSEPAAQPRRSHNAGQAYRDHRRVERTA